MRGYHTGYESVYVRDYKYLHSDGKQHCRCRSVAHISMASLFLGESFSHRKCPDDNVDRWSSYLQTGSDRWAGALHRQFLHRLHYASERLDSELYEARLLHKKREDSEFPWTDNEWTKLFESLTSLAQDEGLHHVPNLKNSTVFCRHNHRLYSSI